MSRCCVRSAAAQLGSDLRDGDDSSGKETLPAGSGQKETAPPSHAAASWKSAKRTDVPTFVKSFLFFSFLIFPPLRVRRHRSRAPRRAARSRAFPYAVYKRQPEAAHVRVPASALCSGALIASLPLFGDDDAIFHPFHRARGPCGLFRDFPGRGGDRRLLDILAARCHRRII